jgi:hypothetical protein
MNNRVRAREVSELRRTSALVSAGIGGSADLVRSGLGKRQHVSRGATPCNKARVAVHRKREPTALLNDIDWTSPSGQPRLDDLDQELLQWGSNPAVATGAVANGEPVGPDASAETQCELEHVETCARNHGIFVATQRDDDNDDLGHSTRLTQLAQIHRDNQTAVCPIASVLAFQTELLGTVDLTSGALMREATLHALPVNRIADELLFMREAVPGCSEERPCRNAGECEARRMASVAGVVPWTMREFLLPSQRERLREGRELPAILGLCLFCMKRNAVIHYATLLYLNQDAHIVVQPFMNICDEDGEFDSNFCLIPFASRFFGILAPLAQHNVGMYTMEVNSAGLGFAAYKDEVYFRLAPVKSRAVPE